MTVQKFVVFFTGNQVKFVSQQLKLILTLRTICAASPTLYSSHF